MPDFEAEVNSSKTLYKEDISKVLEKLLVTKNIICILKIKLSSK